jgi:hypothetical protein
MNPTDFVKRLLECECPCSINEGVLWLENGESFDLAKILKTK